MRSFELRADDGGNAGGNVVQWGGSRLEEVPGKAYFRVPGEVEHRL